MNAIDRIANTIEQIADNGITIHCNLRFPEDQDKFALDLHSMKISESIESLASALVYIGERIDDQ